MNDIVNLMKQRRTIRKYKSRQISERELDAILEAGLHAPSAGGRQSPIILACQNAEINAELGKLNKIQMELQMGQRKVSPGTVSAEQPSILDDENIKSAFYSAPTVLTLFAPKNNFNFTGDCFVAAQNMIIAACSLGIGSCMVARSAETFSTERGMEIQKKWGVSDELEAKVHVTLGYIDGVEPMYKSRKENRVVRV